MLEPRIGRFPDKHGVSPGLSHAGLQDWTLPRQTWGKSRALSSWRLCNRRLQNKNGVSPGPFQGGAQDWTLPRQPWVNLGPSHAEALDWILSRRSWGKSRSLSCWAIGLDASGLVAFQQTWGMSRALVCWVSGLDSSQTNLG
jgi:hypothetical protein